MIGDVHEHTLARCERNRMNGTDGAARRFFGRTTSVLILIVDANPDCGCSARLIGSMDFFQMPASPVCLDTLVLATVGASINLLNTIASENLLPPTGTVRLALRAALTVPVCSDIEHPLLLSGNSNNILMRELFPQSKRNASLFANRLEMLQNRDFAGLAANIPLHR